MSKYLDKDGLIALWAKIKDTYASKDELNAIIDNAPTDYNTLKKIADWIEGYGVDTVELTELINRRKLHIFPVQSYGFDANLRINQIVNGSSLIDAVIEETNTNNRQVMIQAGDYKFNVTAILEANDYKGFAIVGTNLNPTDDNPFPALEKGVFLYSRSLNKTYTFYEKAFTNAEINTQIITILNQTLVPITTAEIDTICDNN